MAGLERYSYSTWRYVDLGDSWRPHHHSKKKSQQLQPESSPNTAGRHHPGIICGCCHGAGYWVTCGSNSCLTGVDDFNVWPTKTQNWTNCLKGDNFESPLGAVKYHNDNHTLGHRTGNVASAWSKTSQNLCAAMMEQERVSQNLVVCCVSPFFLVSRFLMLTLGIFTGCGGQLAPKSFFTNKCRLILTSVSIKNTKPTTTKIEVRLEDKQFGLQG